MKNPPHVGGAIRREVIEPLMPIRRAHDLAKARERGSKIKMKHYETDELTIPEKLEGEYHIGQF